MQMQKLGKASFAAHTVEKQFSNKSNSQPSGSPVEYTFNFSEMNANFYRGASDVSQNNFQRMKEFVNTPGEYCLGEVQVKLPEQMELMKLGHEGIDLDTCRTMLAKIEKVIIEQNELELKGSLFRTLLWLSQDPMVAIELRDLCAESVTKLNKGKHLIGISRSDLENRFLDTTGLHLENHEVVANNEHGGQLSVEIQVRLSKMALPVTQKGLKETKNTSVEPNKNMRKFFESEYNTVFFE